MPGSRYIGIKVRIENIRPTAQELQIVQIVKIPRRFGVNLQKS